MLTVLSMLLAIGVLVTVHEFGHFFVARMFGVHVLCFSVGFGRPLISWKDRIGTEYRIALIPLGGYVRMLDSREAEVSERHLNKAFDNKPVTQRFAIVAAGPLINFLFAALLYGLISSLGTTVMIPFVKEIKGISENLSYPTEIISIDGIETQSWEAANLRLIEKIGDSGSIELALRDLDSSIIKKINLPIPSESKRLVNPIELYGLVPWSPKIKPIISSVQEGGAGEIGGLKSGDRILFVDGLPIFEWVDFVEKVKASANSSIALEVDRSGLLISLIVVPKEKKERFSGSVYGFLGVAPKRPEIPREMEREIRTDFLSSIEVGCNRTITMIKVTLGALGKMMTGVLSVKNLSGPVTIARIAGDSAMSGWVSYLSFLAYLSVSLGVLNLLPIPILDGGHLVFFTFEWIKGQPVSEKTQMISLRFGAIILAGFMILAFYNDLMRELMRF